MNADTSHPASANVMTEISSSPESLPHADSRASAATKLDPIINFFIDLPLFHVFLHPIVDDVTV